MSVNDTSRIVSDNFRMMLQIVASLTDDSRGIIYDCNMFIVQATDSQLQKHQIIHVPLSSYKLVISYL